MMKIVLRDFINLLFLSDFFRCNMRVTEPVVLIIDCPVESLVTGPTLLVMGIEGVVSREALLMSMTLTCDDVGDVKMLNGRVCQNNDPEPDHWGMYICL